MTSEPAMTARSRSSSPVRTVPTVLVDDDEGNRRAMVRILESDG